MRCLLPESGTPQTVSLDPRAPQPDQKREASATTGTGAANSRADAQAATNAQATGSSSSPQATADQAATSRYSEAAANAASADRAAIESTSLASLQNLVSEPTVAMQSSTLSQSTTQGSTLQPPSGTQKSQSAPGEWNAANGQPAPASAAAQSEAWASAITGTGTANSRADAQAATDAQATGSLSNPQATANQATTSRYGGAAANAPSVNRATIESASLASLQNLASDRPAAMPSNTLSQSTTQGNTLQPPSGTQNSRLTAVSGFSGTAGPSVNSNATIAGFSSLPRTALPAVGGAATSNTNDNNGKSDSSGTPSVAKQHTVADSSNAPDNGASADQGQASPNPQPASVTAAVQNAAVSAVNTPLHVAQNVSGHPPGGANSSVSNLPGSSGTSGRTAQAQESALNGTESQPAVAAINAARLIQRVGDSEIRVGMHSAEFGNVSISTIASRGVISAQISLDHGELANTIAAHLPETQARLGANQPVEVRISTNQQGAGSTGGEQGGTQQDTTGKGSGGNRQPGQNYLSASMIGMQETALAGLAATPSESNVVSSRLDIRV